MARTGRILLAILLAAGILGASITGAAMYTRLIIVSVVVIVVSALWTYTSLFGLRIVRSPRSLKASVGDILEENFEISNTSRIPRLWLEVANETSIPSASGSRVLTLLNGRQRRFYLARTWLTRRGAFDLGPTVLKSGDPLGLFTASKRFPATDSLIVLPLLVDIVSFPSPPGLLPGGKAIRQKSSGVTPHAAGVREYVSGDPMKSIHWQSTARRGKLMVKEFEQDPQAEIWLCLDTQMGIHFELPHIQEDQWFDSIFKRKPEVKLPPSTLEYGVTITASLAHYFIQQRRAVGFIASGQVLTIIPAERSDRQESKILETLAFIKNSGQLSIASLVAAQVRFLPLGSSVILVTPATSSEVALAVDELQRRNLRPLVVMLVADSFGGPRGGEKLAQALMERNVPVCQVYQGDNLAKTLATFAAEHFSPEVRMFAKFKIQ